MNLDHDFFRWANWVKTKKKKGSSPKMKHVFSRIQVKTKKKGFHQEWNTFFPEFKGKPALRCRPESNYWGGWSSRHYSYYWGGFSQIIGGYISPILPGFGTHVWYVQNLNTTYLSPWTVLQFKSVPYQRTVPVPLLKRRTVLLCRNWSVPYCHSCFQLLATLTNFKITSL